MPLSPAQRMLRAQVAAYERWARTSQADRAADARRGQAACALASNASPTPTAHCRQPSGRTGPSVSAGRTWPGWL